MSQAISQSRDTENLPALSKGWVWMRLGDVADLLRGVSYAKHESSKEAKGGYVPILRANNIDRELNFDDLVYVLSKRVRDEQFVKAFDILIAMSSGSKDLVGKASQAKNDFQGGFGAFCGLVRINPEMDRKFVGLCFQSPIYRNEISRLSSGVNINNLRRSHIESFSLPLPPLPEQHRIVAKIEELFTRLDAGVEALKKIKAQLKRYRQAVLRDAFQGKLTQGWREAHKGELEPASVLLERIKKELRKNAQGKYRELPPLDTSDLPDLPEGWVWTRLGEIVETVEKTYPKAKPDDEFIYIDIASIDNKQQRIVQPKRYLGKEAPSRARQLVRSGDVLFSTVRTYLKNVAMVNELYNGQIASTGFAVIRSYSSIVSKLVFCWVQTEAFLNPLTEIQRGTSYPAVRDSDVFAQSIPLPPLPEQHKIVEEIERRLSVADEIEKAVDQSLKQAVRLRQSILKRAFEGKLVPQDPTDEPAEKLLERIREERAERWAQAPAKKQSRNKI